MEIRGIDCGAPLTVDKVKAIAASGVKFICRYLAPNGSWKRLTADEATLISNAGMQIISVYEKTADRTKGGKVNGEADGSEAYQIAQSIEQPKGSTIYFAVDFDAQPSDYNSIEAYLKAANSKITGYEIGVYGSYAVIEEMVKRNVVKRYWQTYAWSKGKKSAHANVYQYLNGQTLAGHTVDLNYSYGNEGWWNTLSQKTTNVVIDKDAALKVIAVLGALHTASLNKDVQEAAHYAADALRDAVGISK